MLRLALPKSGTFSLATRSLDAHETSKVRTGWSPGAGRDGRRPATPETRLNAGTSRLVLLFGALAFFQGIAEPSDGLIAQPAWSLLKRWGHGTADLGAFSMWVGLAWVLKPCFGLLTDFVPLCGRRRQGYLILAGGLAAVSMFGLASLPMPSTRYAWLLGWLAAATVAWSFADVVADALLIDRGRGSGLIGRLQAAQWGSAFAAGIVAGVGGGWLSEGGRERLGFSICGLAATATLCLAAFAVRDPRVSGPAVGARETARALARAARSPTVLGVGAFLFLWNFNPFSTVVLYSHMTRTLGIDEAFFGLTQAVMALGSILGCAAYPQLARRASSPALVRLSIVLGVASTLAYGGLSGRASALAISFAVGIIYMIATLIQLDLAARACPPEAAGCVFASLMALENLAVGLSTGLGSWWYDKWADTRGASTSFHALIVIGAAFTAASWLLRSPGVPREDQGPSARQGRTRP